MLGFNPISSLPISAIPALVTARAAGGAPNYQYRGEYEIEQPGTISDFLRTDSVAEARRKRLEALRRELGLIPEPIEAAPPAEPAPDVVSPESPPAVAEPAPVVLPAELRGEVAADVAALLRAELAAEIEAERLDAIAAEAAHIERIHRDDEAVLLMVGGIAW